MDQITVENLRKSFWIAERMPGIWGAIKGLAARRHRRVAALHGVSSSVSASIAVAGGGTTRVITDLSVKTRSSCGVGMRSDTIDVSPSIFGVIVGSMVNSTPLGGRTAGDVFRST